MARNVKVNLYDSFNCVFYDVSIPMPTTEDSTRKINEETGRKVVIRNWGNNDYSAALFDNVDQLETKNVVRGKMSHVAGEAAEFLY